MNDLFDTAKLIFETKLYLCVDSFFFFFIKVYENSGNEMCGWYEIIL